MSLTWIVALAKERAPKTPGPIVQRKWTVCSCGDIAQDHDKDGKCLECKKCKGYDGRIL